MIFFELKKMWRNRTVLWLFLFTVALIFFVNYRSARIRLEDEYPPYRGVPALRAFSANYHRVMRERELQGLSTLEMERDLKIKDGISKDYFSLKAQIPSHFRGYSEEGLELEKIYMKRLEVWNKLLKKYNISLDFQFDQEDTWQWAMFEKNYAQKHGVHTMSDVVEVPLSNAARRILFNSRFLFGAPVMLCFLFLFGGILSQEREHGTEELLMMQPRKRIHILFSKLLAVWTMALLYVLMLGVLLFLSFLWLNLPIDGFGEIYRVLDPSDPLRYVVGIDLLVQILLSFLMMVALLTGFMFFVSARSEDTMGTMALLLVLSVWLYVLTEKFSVFQKPWNPVYALDYLQVINGRYARNWSEVASESFSQHYENILYGNGLKWYGLMSRNSTK